MARSEEAQAFFHAVYSAVQEIPHGKVTSYGHIAKLVGTRMQTLPAHIGSRDAPHLDTTNLPFRTTQVEMLTSNI